MEEQYFPLTQEIKNEFNPNDLYKQALEEDISWRKWQPWLTDKIIERMKEDNPPENKEPEPAQEEGATAGDGKKEDKDCVVS